MTQRYPRRLVVNWRTVALLEAILADLPRLDGASCRGQFALYDVLPGRGPERSAAERERLQAAVELCAGCPARPACPESLSSRPV